MDYTGRYFTNNSDGENLRGYETLTTFSKPGDPSKDNIHKVVLTERRKNYSDQTSASKDSDSLFSPILFPPASIDLVPKRFLPDGSQPSISSALDNELFNEMFLGAMKEKNVRKHLKVNDFRIYYRMPKSRTKITQSLPLMIGYMASNQKVYHFALKRSDRNYWHVLAGKRIGSFSSLSALIRYHKIYSYINPTTGCIDTFPIDDDDDVEN